MQSLCPQTGSASQEGAAEGGTLGKDKCALMQSWTVRKQTEEVTLSLSRPTHLPTVGFLLSNCSGHRKLGQSAKTGSRTRQRGWGLSLLQEQGWTSERKYLRRAQQSRRDTQAIASPKVEGWKRESLHCREKSGKRTLIKWKTAARRCSSSVLASGTTELCVG